MAETASDYLPSGVETRDESVKQHGVIIREDHHFIHLAHFFKEILETGTLVDDQPFAEYVLGVE